MGYLFLIVLVVVIWLVAAADVSRMRKEREQDRIDSAKYDIKYTKVWVPTTFTYGYYKTVRTLHPKKVWNCVTGKYELIKQVKWED